MITNSLCHTLFKYRYTVQCDYLMQEMVSITEIFTLIFILFYTIIDLLSWTFPSEAYFLIIALETCVWLKNELTLGNRANTTIVVLKVDQQKKKTVLYHKTNVWKCLGMPFKPYFKVFRSIVFKKLCKFVLTNLKGSLEQWLFFSYNIPETKYNYCISYS